MITLERPAYFDAYRYAEYDGLSTDNKSTIDAHNGDKFYEIDTGKVYRYNEASGKWVEQPDTTTAVDTGLPPITDETAGHFLSNDGNVTHWQEFASQDFIINLTAIQGQEGEYTADKTYVEIKQAFDAKENIAVHYDNARLPLMNAQFIGDDAGLTFGYTQVTTDGQLVSTRAINYFHTASPVNDEWTDADQAAEYLRLNGGTMSGPISMAANSITDVQELSTADTHPLILGNVIRSSADGVRITSTTNNEAAVVAPNSQAEYRPINVGEPTAPNHAVNLAYLAQEVKDDAATKNHVTVAKDAAITIGLQDGVYFVSACDTIHRGLSVVYMCGSTTTFSALSGMAGWEISKGAVDNSLYINNKSNAAALEVYITAIGASAAF